MSTEAMLPMIDITEPEHIAVSIREDGHVIWVNVDGICRLRLCSRNPLVLVVEDHRRKEVL